MELALLLPLPPLAAPEVVLALEPGAGETVASAAKTSEEAYVLQLLVAAEVGWYGIVEIAPSDSGGCAYDCVAPAASVYTPGTGNESESQTSKRPSAGVAPSVYLDGQLYKRPIRSSVCWQ